MWPASFTSKQTSELSGLPYPTLSFLKTQGWLTPSLKAGTNRGAASVYSIADVVALRALAQLRAAPATFEKLKDVIELWRKKEVQEVLAATDWAVENREPLPARRYLVVTAQGSVALTETMALLDLVQQFDSAVLHVIDVCRVWQDVRLGVTELQMLGRYAEPGPTGRVPRENGELNRPDEKGKRTKGHARLAEAEAKYRAKTGRRKSGKTR